MKDKGLQRLGDIVKAMPKLQNVLDAEIIRPEDLVYTHSVFLQCFLPLRHNVRNKRRWQADCGNASLVMRAGELVKPNSPGTFAKPKTIDVKVF